MMPDKAFERRYIVDETTYRPHILRAVVVAETFKIRILLRTMCQCRLTTLHTRITQMIHAIPL